MKTTTPLLLSTILGLAACGAAPTDEHSEAGPKPAAPANADQSPSPDAATTGSVYALEATTLAGEPVSMADYAGKVTLIVNVASECGYTGQYAGLQQLHDELAGRGFAVLGFPSNEFGGQEPGTAEQIREFCTSKFGVEFPMFAKVEVREGAGQSPIYATLQAATGKQPGWNFCKYLVGKDGAPIAFYESSVKPGSEELRAAIEAALE